MVNRRRSRSRSAVAAASALALGGLLARCASSRGPAATPTAPTSLAPATVAPSGVAGGPLTPVAIGFTDTEHGMLLTASCATSCTFKALTTDDGGDAYQAAGVVTQDPTDVPGVVDGLLVNGPDAMAWGQGGAWLSQNDGRTWSPHKLADGVQDIVSAVAVGRSWWVLQDPSGHGSGGDVILTSDDGGATFSGLAGTVPAGVLSLARGDVDSAVLLYDDHLAVTLDAGVSWASRARPCPAGPFADGEGLVAEAPDSTIWLACGGEPSAGFQAKALYVSADSGRTWTTVENCIPDPNACTWPGGTTGYLAALASPAAASVWMGAARGSLVGSIDGGRTWLTPLVGGGDLGATRIYFLDPDHGWAIVERQVWRTTDGGNSWRPAGQLGGAR